MAGKPDGSFCSCLGGMNWVPGLEQGDRAVTVEMEGSKLNEWGSIWPGTGLDITSCIRQAISLLPSSHRRVPSFTSSFRTFSSGTSVAQEPQSHPDGSPSYPNKRQEGLLQFPWPINDICSGDHCFHCKQVFLHSGHIPSSAYPEDHCSHLSQVGDIQNDYCSAALRLLLNGMTEGRTLTISMIRQSNGLPEEVMKVPSARQAAEI